ncbi:cilia- and flagella-associated protein 276 [Synchiropus picturatus]
MSERDPFCSPKTENDFTLSGFRPQQMKPYDKPTHLAQNEEPWSRLHSSGTFSSSQRSVWQREQQTPLDSLDFHLASVYDHHKDFFWRKNQVLCQREATTEKQRNRHRDEKNVQSNNRDDQMKVWVDPKRSSIHSIK